MMRWLVTACLALSLAGCETGGSAGGAGGGGAGAVPESPPSSPAPPQPAPEPAPQPAPPPPPPPSVLSEAIYVAWLPHWDTTVVGYRIYFGRSLDATTPVRDVAASSCTPQQCETVFDSLLDLNASYGDTICFQVAALNGSLEQSARSPGVCMTFSSVTARYVDGRWPCGAGLASTDLAGACRRNPPTMGALEATA